MGCSKLLINAVWELTLRCNAHCVHCGSSAGIDRKDNLSNDEIMYICEELAELNCKTVALIGGEVFLHPLWREIVRKLRSLNIDVQIITNALSLNKEKIEFLSLQKIETLGISLDGSNADIHDSIRNVPGIFNHIMSLSEDIKRTTLPTIAITTVTRKNILDLPNLMQLVYNSFFCTWQIQIGNPFGRLSKNMALSELEFYIVGIFVALMQKRYKGKYPSKDDLNVAYSGIIAILNSSKTNKNLYIPLVKILTECAKSGLNDAENKEKLEFICRNIDAKDKTFGVSMILSNDRDISDIILASKKKVRANISKVSASHQLEGEKNQSTNRTTSYKTNKKTTRSIISQHKVSLSK